jgi:26S proteasome regulatory subunit N7
VRIPCDPKGNQRISHTYLLPQAQKIATEGGGGDWDRRNRLKVYRALSKMLSRDIKGAAGLLIDCIATFSCNEICSYQEFIVYAIMTNVLHLPRPELKEKILDGPEILSVASDIPVIVSLSIYYYAYIVLMLDILTSCFLSFRSN